VSFDARLCGWDSKPSRASWEKAIERFNERKPEIEGLLRTMIEEGMLDEKGEAVLQR
jgi:hypothetical protein